MSYQFKRLSEVEALTEVPEGAKVLAEANGKIVRVPGSGLGGGTGSGMLIVNVDFDNKSVDCSFEDIVDAIKQGRGVVLRNTDTKGNFSDFNFLMAGIDRVAFYIVSVIPAIEGVFVNPILSYEQVFVLNSGEVARQTTNYELK